MTVNLANTFKLQLSNTSVKRINPPFLSFRLSLTLCSHHCLLCLFPPDDLNFPRRSFKSRVLVAVFIPLVKLVSGVSTLGNHWTCKVIRGVLWVPGVSRPSPSFCMVGKAQLSQLSHCAVTSFHPIFEWVSSVSGSCVKMLPCLEGRVSDKTMALSAKRFHWHTLPWIRSLGHPSQYCQHWLTGPRQNPRQGPLPALLRDVRDWTWVLLYTRKCSIQNYSPSLLLS